MKALKNLGIYPTPHVRIPISEGIRYLTCSVFTRSEIVVPIYNVGEIDIDKEVWEECI
jgi:hypothetical protein